MIVQIRNSFADEDFKAQVIENNSRDFGKFAIKIQALSLQPFSQVSICTDTLAILFSVEAGAYVSFSNNCSVVDRNIEVPGAFFILSAGQSCLLKADSEQQFLVIKCDKTQLNLITNEYNVSVQSIVDTLADKSCYYDFDVRISIQMLWHKMNSGGEFTGIFVDGLWLKIVSKLIDMSVPSATNATGDNAIDLKKLESAVLANIHKPILVTDIAEHCQMPETQFTRHFKKAMQETPYQYVIRKRLEKAQSLLLSKHSNLTEVARCCGFSSQTHMNDIFREKLGVTPKQYQRSIAL